MIFIILPVRNESLTVEKTATEVYRWCLLNLKKDFMIVFIDDGSKDATADIINQMKNNKITVIKNRFDNGKGSALKSAVILSDLIYKTKDSDLIIFMDGDGQINPAEISTFLNLMNLYNADVVIGNKRHPFSFSHYGLRRKVVSKIYNFMIRHLFGLTFSDTQCGIKIFKKPALDKVIDKITIKKFAFDLELIVALRETGLRIVDAPVVIRNQLNAGSVNFHSIFETFFDTIKVYNKMKKGFYVNG